MSAQPSAAPTAEPATRTGTTALLVSVLLLVSSVLGLARDLSLAGLFGATGDTDAFLVAWTVPETVSTLLMEGAMSFLLVPVFVAELARSGSVARIVRGTLLPVLTVLALLTAVVVVAAPVLVDLLAPGIASRDLAVRCFRVAALTVLFMGLSGYLMAALRANHRFVLPAGVNVAYNVGILATMYALHQRFGVFAAALGLAVGSALMVALQVRGFLRVTSLRGLRLRLSRRLMLAAGAFVPIAAYSLGRQLQVYVERVVGSTLTPGSISYMNYASKVAQMASLLALTAAAVAFPSMARLAHDRVALRGRVEKEMRRLLLLITPAIAFMVVFAEPCIRLLFEHGAFDATDTARTATIMRVYCLGLLGQVLVSLGAYVSFGSRRGIWRPAAAAVTGLLVTTVLDVALAPVLGVVALAIGNAVGISVSALLVWVGIRRHVVELDVRGQVRLLAFACGLSAVTAGVAWLVCLAVPANALADVLVGGTVTLALFLVLTALANVPESQELVRAVRRGAARAVSRNRRGA
ncbi:MAG: oligosaccharide flippase family protein [Nocardioidaceae bacterium]|nr:oligosaccharide flippase family protein [Nocardioidaceae bacterium]